jgi:hypothetical protein
LDYPYLYWPKLPDASAFTGALDLLDIDPLDITDNDTKS